MKTHPPHLDQRGQGLIEYLIIVAIMAVSTIGIVSIMGQTVKGKFASITSSLQGRTQKLGPTSVDANLYQKSDLGNFFENSGNTSQ
jgi:pilus assembly protein Flp/PilA